jgi:hypothetical protein
MSGHAGRDTFDAAGVRFEGEQFFCGVSRDRTPAWVIGSYPQTS